MIKQQVMCFKMRSGEKFTMIQDHYMTPGFYTGAAGNCFPDEMEAIGDAEFYIDGERVDYLKKGLEKIVERMQGQWWAYPGINADWQ